MSLILDLLISTYTNVHSYLFLNVLNQNKITYIIFIGLIIDLVLANTNGAVTFVLIFLFYINKYINNYYLKNLFNYFFVIILLNFKFTFSGLFLQMLFIYLMHHHIIKW